MAMRLLGHLFAWAVACVIFSHIKITDWLPQGSLPQLHMTAVVAQDAQRRKRSEPQNLKYFVQNVSKMGGWITEADAYITFILSALQRLHGITGRVGEVGVHHGKYFSIVAATAQEEEDLFACDLFADQALNVDGSGKGDFAHFMRNIKQALGADFIADRLRVVANSSLLLGRTIQIPNDFRFFSVDGGHTEVITFSDLIVAASHIVPGGIVALDDIFNREWPGVASGAQNYFHMLDRRFDRLRPLLLGSNKLFFTTASHHAKFLKTLQQLVQIGKWGLSGTAADVKIKTIDRCSLRNFRWLNTTWLGQAWDQRRAKVELKALNKNIVQRNPSAPFGLPSESPVWFLELPRGPCGHTGAYR